MKLVNISLSPSGQKPSGQGPGRALAIARMGLMLLLGCARWGVCKVGVCKVGSVQGGGVQGGGVQGGGWWCLTHSSWGAAGSCSSQLPEVEADCTGHTRSSLPSLPGSTSEGRSERQDPGVPLTSLLAAARDLPSLHPPVREGQPPTASADSINVPLMSWLIGSKGQS